MNEAETNGSPVAEPAISPDPIARLIAKSTAVKELDMARAYLRDAAKQLDLAGEMAAQELVRTVLSSTEDTLEHLAGGDES